LTALGYDVVAAVASGADALREVNKKPPDLILMDIRLEGDIDGIETTKSIPPEFCIPVIFITAHSEESTLQRARKAHAYGYLLKPFSDRELHATIQMVLERRKIDVALRETAVELAAQSASVLLRLSTSPGARAAPNPTFLPP
jgi:CheY-like chemotaxis protein